MATLAKDTDLKMKKAIEAMQKAFAGVRTGKASPTLVDGIMVEYYGTLTKLRDVAAITAPEPRLLVIQPWDQGAIKAIEKAILASNLGISPMSDGRVVRLPIPELSEERRKEYVKLVRTRAEDCRIEIRNLRREGNEAAKKLQKDGAVTEDDLAKATKEIQKLTDDHIKQVDQLLAAKETELMSL
ncbi:MAG: ribosome recycling factor [Lentisphaeria bacterium]